MKKFGPSTELLRGLTQQSFECVDPTAKLVVLLPHSHSLSKDERVLLESKPIDETWSVVFREKTWIFSLLRSVDRDGLIDQQLPPEGWDVYTKRLLEDLSGPGEDKTRPKGNMCLTYTQAFRLSSLSSGAFKTEWCVSDDTFHLQSLAYQAERPS